MTLSAPVFLAQQLPGVDPMNTLARIERAVLLSLLLSSCGCGPSADFVSPMLAGPIIIFDIDTLRADHLGCYGYNRPTSPNIDRLARESFRFEWAFSQAPDTGPSHSSIFTGLYPSTHGVRHNGTELPQEANTLAEALQEAGYRTAAFVDGGYMRSIFGMDQGFEYYQSYRGEGLESSGPEVLDFLRKYSHLKFFLLIHTYDVHAPYSSPEPFCSRFSGDSQPSPGFVPTMRQLDQVRKSAWTHRPIRLSESDLEFTKARYDGAIRFVDHWIGQFFDEIKKLGLDQRATIVLLSDHGEAFQEQGFLQHDRLFAPVTRIPFIIRPPGGVNETVVSSSIQSIDLMPTLLEGAGISAMSHLQGRSLMPLLRGGTMRERPAISESPYYYEGEGSIVWEGHQLTTTFEDRHPGGQMLFDLEQDPRALRNVLTESPQTAATLSALLAEWKTMVDQRGRTTSETAATLDETAERELRALGYIN